MSQENVLRNNIANLLHTVLLLILMLALMATLGLLLAGASGLLWVSGLGLLFLLFSQQLSPQLVLKAFGARPLSAREAPGLYRIVADLSRRAGLKDVPRLYYARSQQTNAFTVGNAEDAAIGVTDRLLSQLSRRELTGVLAHEISHLCNKDVRVLTLAAAINRITSLFSFFGQVLLFINLPLLLMGRAPISWLAVALLIAAPTLAALLQSALSRTREFHADLGAVRLTGDPEGLASALSKLELHKIGLLERILGRRVRAPESSPFSTHPETRERVERLMRLRDAGKPSPTTTAAEPLRVAPGRPPLTPWKPRWDRFGA